MLPGERRLFSDGAGVGPTSARSAQKQKPTERISIGFEVSVQMWFDNRLLYDDIHLFKAQGT